MFTNAWIYFVILFQVREMVVAILSECGMDVENEILESIIDKVIVCWNMCFSYVV